VRKGETENEPKGDSRRGEERERKGARQREREKTGKAERRVARNASVTHRVFCLGRNERSVFQGENESDVLVLGKPINGRLV